MSELEIAFVILPSFAVCKKSQPFGQLSINLKFSLLTEKMLWLLLQGTLLVVWGIIKYVE